MKEGKEWVRERRMTRVCRGKGKGRVCVGGGEGGDGDIPIRSIYMMVCNF